MAKKLNNVYLEENRELETHTILVEGDDKKPKKNGKKPENKVWAVLRPIVAFVIALVVVAGVVYYAYGYVKGSYFDPVDTEDASQVEVTIPKGSSLSTISKILKENDIIRSEQVFKLYVDFSDMSGKMKAGTYELSRDMEFDDIIYTLNKGMNAEPTAKALLREGFCAEDFAKELVTMEIQPNGDAYLKLCKTAEGLNVSSELEAIIKEDSEASEKRKYVLEGYLFPDTYEFFKDADPKTVINKQLARFNEMFDESYYDRMAELDMSLDDVITLASVIEKESKTDQFRQVSAVLHNRLDSDMPLQCDSTIAYALGVKRINLTTPELETESPYNTHINQGLPLGPICNPGKDAIYAALYPDEEYMEEGYLYFTLTDPETGVLAFSKTLEEHDAVVAEWKPLWDEADREAAAGAN